MLVVAWDGSPHPSAAAEAMSGKQASAEMPRCSERGSLESKPSFPTGQDSEGGGGQGRSGLQDSVWLFRSPGPGLIQGSAMMVPRGNLLDDQSLNQLVSALSGDCIAYKAYNSYYLVSKSLLTPTLE